MTDSAFPKRFSEADKALWLWLAIQNADAPGVVKALLDGKKIEISDISGSRPNMRLTSCDRYDDERDGEIMDLLLAAGANPYPIRRYRPLSTEREVAANELFSDWLGELGFLKP